MVRMPNSRRNILRGMGAGAFLLAPMMRQTRAAAAGKQTGHFLAFCTPNGHVRSQFGGSGDGASFTLKPSLAPLAPFKSRLAVLTLDNPPGNGSHEDLNKVLTCVRDAMKYRASGPSLDWVIANHFGSRPINATTMVTYTDWHAQLSWKAAGVPAGNVNSASSIYGDVFANAIIPQQGSGPAPAAGAVDRLVEQRRSVLDFVMQDIAMLKPRLAAPERFKLDNHLDSLRQIEKKLVPSAPTAAPAAGCSKSNAKAAVDAANGGSEADRLRRSIEVTSDVIAMAFACGLRHSATLLTQPASKGINPFVPGAATEQNHHGVSHGGGGGGATWAKIDVWYAERFAYLLQRLIDLNVADTTIVAWVSEISEPHNQNGSVIPLFGGGALGMQMGRASAPGTTLGNLWVSVKKALGMPGDTFGTDGSGKPPGPADSGGVSGLWRPV